MRAFIRVGEVEYSLTPLTEKEFRAAFCSEYEIDGQITYTIKALAGYPSFFVPENRNLLWPLPFKELEVIFEEDNVP